MRETEELVLRRKPDGDCSPGTDVKFADGYAVPEALNETTRRCSHCASSPRSRSSKEGMADEETFECVHLELIQALPHTGSTASDSSRHAPSIPTSGKRPEPETASKTVQTPRRCRKPRYDRTQDMV